MPLIAELVGHPVTALALPVMIWVWSKIFVEEWDPKSLTLAYSDCLQKKQYYRMITAPCTNRSVVQLLINMVFLWSCKSVESDFGSWFVFRYTFLLLVCEAGMSFALIKFLSRNEVLTHLLQNLHSSGCSGLVLAWLAFLSIARRDDRIIYLGLVPVHPGVAVLPTIFINYLLGPSSNVYSSLSGLMCGYLLSSGFLQLLPDTYWSVCFLINLAFFCTVMPAADSSSSSSSSSGEEGNIVEVTALGEEIPEYDESSSSDEEAQGGDEGEAAFVSTPHPSSSLSQLPPGASNPSFVAHRLGSMFRPRGQRGAGVEPEENQPLLSSAV